MNGQEKSDPAALAREGVAAAYIWRDVVAYLFRAFSAQPAANRRHHVRRGAVGVSGVAVGPEAAIGAVRARPLSEFPPLLAFLAHLLAPRVAILAHCGEHFAQRATRS